MCLDFRRIIMELKVCFLTCLMALTFCGSYVQGRAYFTRYPNVVYVDSTGNKKAEFIWDYHVDDRDKEFSGLSPRWSFFNGSDEKPLIVEDQLAPVKWDWKIADDCPARFRRRVSKKSNATLVISNVTAADNGIYGCTLVVSSPITKKAKLIFTVPPQINISGETNVTQNTNLTLNCSAVGPPTPNVTWIKDGVVLGQGIQSAMLFIANIKKEQNGTYCCNATNNPERGQEQGIVTVTVKFPAGEPSDRSRYKNNYKVCLCDKVEIAYGAIGYPPPTFYWYSPSNESVGENKTGKESKIKVDPIHGNWTCHITNGIGKGIYYRFEMEVLPSNHEDCKHCPKLSNDCLSTGTIAGIIIGVLVGVGIIAVIGVVIYKKVKKDDKRISLKALVAVIIAVLLVSGIIVAIIVAILGQCIKAGLVVGITFGVVGGVGIIAVIVVVIYLKK